MTFGFKLGKRLGVGRPTPEQREILARLERGEITAEEAGRLLGGVGREWRYSTDGAAGDGPEAQPRAETEEEAKARELVERIAREVDEELQRGSA